MNTKAWILVFTVMVGIALGSSQLHAVGNDALLQAAIQESYMFKTYLKDDNINVQSVNGVVTLSGTVADESHKSIAQDTVENLPDVKGVVNQLQVTSESTSLSSDAWLSVKVKALLLFRRNVSAMTTKVFVKDGIVTLEGEANSQEQRELINLYIKDLEGVKGVNNKIIVVEKKVPTFEILKEKIDDASVTAQVKMMLLFNRSTNALKTGVQTNKGTVTLTGIVNSVAQKNLVTKLVMDVNGVEEVINTMEVSK